MSLISDAINKARDNGNPPHGDQAFTARDQPHHAGDQSHPTAPQTTKLAATVTSCALAVAGLLVLTHYSILEPQKAPAASSTHDHLEQSPLSHQASSFTSETDFNTRYEQATLPVDSHHSNPLQQQTNPVHPDRTDLSKPLPSQPFTEPDTDDRDALKPAPRTLIDGQTFIKVVDTPPILPLNLDSIVWSPSKPVASINGILVRPGDDLWDVRVISIQRQQVKLKAENITFSLRLP